MKLQRLTDHQVETIHSAFPDIPVANIVYHLTKTRSAQATSEEILERGFLPAVGLSLPRGDPNPLLGLERMK
jgi:hypothetical protein